MPFLVVRTHRSAAVTGTSLALSLVLSITVFAADRVTLAPARDPQLGSIERGKLTVFENRDAQSGRTLELNILVLKSRQSPPQPDPVFVLAGGPGQAATRIAHQWADSWMRETRDLVLVDQRGTGESNPLRVAVPGSDGDAHGCLESMWSPAAFRAALRDLERVADLTQYTTPIAMDDLDEVRSALGYEQINLVGGSYGTRAALVYMRQHEAHVRCAILNGVAPLAFTNPLYHAAGAQATFDLLCAEVAGDPVYEGCYDHLRDELAEVLARLDRQPALVKVRDERGGQEVSVRLTRSAFADSLQHLLYSLEGNRMVPAMIHRAATAGDFAPFVRDALVSNRWLRAELWFGMLMCVVGSEDIPRIAPESIARETANTFLGDTRVREQMAIAAFWPRGRVPGDYGEPVRVKTPVLVFSGALDPVTGPRWGAEAARHLEHGLHVVVAQAHGVGGDPRIEALQRDFLARGSVDGLDPTACQQIQLPKCAIIE